MVLVLSILWLATIIVIAIRSQLRWFLQDPVVLKQPFFGQSWCGTCPCCSTSSFLSKDNRFNWNNCFFEATCTAWSTGWFLDVRHVLLKTNISERLAQANCFAWWTTAVISVSFWTFSGHGFSLTLCFPAINPNGVLLDKEQEYSSQWILATCSGTAPCVKACGETYGGMLESHKAL